MTYSYALIAVALIALFFELIKSTATKNTAVIEQTVSTLVFVIYPVQFIVSPDAAEPTFFVLGMISMVEMLARFIILISEARRDISIRE